MERQEQIKDYASAAKLQTVRWSGDLMRRDV